MIARIVDETLHGPVEEVFVVTGPESGGIREALADRPVTFVTNSDIESEMLASVRCGLRALPGKCAATLVVLGDQPGLTSGLISLLTQAFHTAGRGLVLPSHAGKRGHPPLISIKYRDEILARYDETGLRGLFNAHPKDVFEVELPASEIFEDMDYPEDYRRIAARHVCHGKTSVQTAQRAKDASSADYLVQAHRRQEL